MLEMDSVTGKQPRPQTIGSTKIDTRYHAVRERHKGYAEKYRASLKSDCVSKPIKREELQAAAMRQFSTRLNTEELKLATASSGKIVDSLTPTHRKLSTQYFPTWTTRWAKQQKRSGTGQVSDNLFITGQHPLPHPGQRSKFRR